MSQQESGSSLSGWAVGGITFAATMMFMIGAFQVIAGLVAIFDDGFYVVTENYTFDLDTSAWGWIHLLLGILLLLAALRAVLGRDVGLGARDRARRADGDRELLLHPVLPVLVDRRDRALRLGDLGVDASHPRKYVLNALGEGASSPVRPPYRRLGATASPSRSAGAPPA